MSGLMLAVLVAVVGAVASGVWFGVMRRRKAETELGVQALANLKWRDCIAVVLEALYRDGYQRSAVAETPAGGASEVMLSRNGQDVLLEYKHGTAYHLSDANVREFVNNVSLNGAREGILVTLGSCEPSALRVAATHNVQLISGPALWPKVRNYVLPSLLESVRAQAAAQTRKGLYASALASVVAGGVVYALLGGRVSPDHELAVADAEAAPARAQPQVQAQRSDTAMVAQINATAKAMEEVAKMTPEQLALRRVEVAKRVAALPRVGQAVWPAQKTLQVNLDAAGDDAGDSQLLGEVCRLLLQQEEMRFSRVQMESPPDSGRRVRWQRCE
jgi:restriction system protein